MNAVTEVSRPLSANRRVLGAATAVTAAVVMVKLAAVLKEFTVAGIYGRSDAYEAFLTAALIPALLVNLISESMSQALVPSLVLVREQHGCERAQRLLSNVLVATTALLGVVSAATAASARWFFPLLGSHFSSTKLDLAVHLFYGLLPVVFLAGIASNCTAVLNTTGRFGLPGLAPIAGPLAVIVVVLAWTGQGIWAMVYATVAGSLIHSVWVVGMFRGSGYRFSFRWHGLDEGTVEVARQYGPVLLSGLVASGGLIVDQAMAAMLPAGNVAALAYGGRFVSVALALLGGSVSSAVTPVFAEMTARSDWDGCRRSLRVWAEISAGAAALVGGALILGSHMLVRLMFQHGSFRMADSAAVSLVLEMYAIQIPFFVCSRVPYRFLVAMRRTDLIFYCGLGNLALDIVLNMLLMHWMGVAGIALATSLWTISTLALLSYWGWRVLPRRTEATRPERVG